MPRSNNSKGMLVVVVFVKLKMIGFMFFIAILLLLLLYSRSSCNSNGCTCKNHGNHWSYPKHLILSALTTIDHIIKKRCTCHVLGNQDKMYMLLNC